MAKTTKKKNRRLKRQIRKTVGALLMVSAITVAAIPVQDVRGADGDPTPPAPLSDKVWIWDSDISANKPLDPAVESSCQSTIPKVAANETIYSSGDGKFQFAYVNPSTGGNKVAVILNYVSDNLPNGTLEIKNSMEAFRKFRPTSTEGYYCLVTQNDEFMFYDVYEQDTAIVNGREQLLYWVPELKYRADGQGDNGRYPTTEDSEEVGTSYLVDASKLSGDGKYHRPYKKTNDAGEEVEAVDVYEVEACMVTHQRPCYYEARDVENGWGSMEDTKLYYLVKDSTPDPDNGKPYGDLQHPVGIESTHNRINATVAYIGKQFIDNITEPVNGIEVVTGWKVRTTGESKALVYRTQPNDGVFAGYGNIANLIIGASLSGISDYAFYGTSIKSIEFGNNLMTIGNGAFEGCIRLKDVVMPEENNLKALGKEAFKGCTALTDFQVPISVESIGDSCFEGCTFLEHIELWGGSAEEAPQTSKLQTIGNYAFKDCGGLGSLFLPSQYSESDLQIAVFEGCGNLQVVRVPNKAANFADSESYTFEQFKSIVPQSFYFWGADTDSENRNNRSALHMTANNEEIAYKYWDRELYEIVKSESDDAGSSKITYQVNDGNELEKIWIEGNPVNVVIPSKIGPYGISTIASGCFDNACTLKKITIPKSVHTIADEAFMGSHALETIIFEDSTTVETIGKDAFRTQVTSCGHTPATKDPSLIIVGAMMDAEGKDTEPFAYAMQRENMINNTSQNESWITCHSGWPTNLEVKYSYDFTTQKGGAELQSYPRYSNFVKGDDDPDNLQMVPDEVKIRDYVSKLPYKNTSAETQEAVLVDVIKNAIAKYEANNPTNPPTVMETQIVNASKNIVVPTNVDSLKPGIFSGYTYKTDADGNILPKETDILDNPDAYLTSVVLNGVDVVDPFTFTGCVSLRNVSVIGANELGDYAFGALETEDPLTGKINDGAEARKESKACESLTNVTLGSQIVTTGLRPFRGCSNLSEIECLGDNLSYTDGLLFNYADGGKVLVECLPGRGDIVGSVTVRAEELAGVTALQEEAFMDCNTIRNVNLSESQIAEISRSAFENADQLSSIILSDTIGSIEADAFVNDPMLNEITIPSSVTYIENGVFISEPKQQKIELTCKEGSAAYRYGTSKLNSGYITVNTNMDEYYYAQFIDYPDYPDLRKEDFGDLVKVKTGEAAPTPATTPGPHNGYTFRGWQNNNPNTIALLTVEILPQFGSVTHTVTFKDQYTMKDIEGYEAIPKENGQGVSQSDYPAPPDHSDDNMAFAGWSWNNDVDPSCVTTNITIWACYEKMGSDNTCTVTLVIDDAKEWYSVERPKGSVYTPPATPPAREGYTFTQWLWSPAESQTAVNEKTTLIALYQQSNSNGGSSGGNGSGNGNGSGSNSSPSPSVSPSPSPGDNVKKYTVSVSGGSGSGSYAAGEIVAINAYYMGEGQSFDKWTSSTAGVGFSNPNATSATFTMPAANVAITATYKTGGSGVTPVSSSGGGGSTVNTVNNGTTVDVTRPGFSNTNLAGATVSGSTDNFIVKVTEDQNATNAVTAALQARYGDLSRIKYLPMDISLYDSTGRTKIADTSGISVNLTIPLPDDLIQYAGNNRVAAVSGGALEDLNARFTTVGGVPCVNFTATHFSPYVIYVDTANLTEATIDTTPKTGDPIHPKWFLAIGLACISLILFFKRDKVVINAKTA